MNFYNEHDPKAAAWLRELIKTGVIAEGVVDERSIDDITPAELTQYNQVHFFAGIGGWSAALRLAGWPDDKPVWTGSCPCQPFSQAGEGKGVDDERHLWPSFKWHIEQCNPSVIFGEQVASNLGRDWLSGVRLDLEDMGYGVGAADLCAACVGAPHPRQRIFWVADTRRASDQFDGECGHPPTANLEPKGVEAKRKRGRVASTDCSENGGLVLADRSRRDERRQRAETIGHGGSIESAGCDGPGRVEHSKGDGWEQWRAESSGRRTEFGRCWSNFDVLPFKDGKFRRVEAGTFPLAHGVSDRVGLLRGYGNAIVSQVAAEFIKAFLAAV